MILMATFVHLGLWGFWLFVLQTVARLAVAGWRKAALIEDAEAARAERASIMFAAACFAAILAASAVLIAVLA